ncbi:MAG TPA: helix-turn-helix domain-containing protein [Actinomycetota bacterium]|jgi:prepilin-type processing-associated H-X9-DG protein|nr:helix-turn-helix domain-containing protein [Actinomycetota bacterium]
MTTMTAQLPLRVTPAPAVAIGLAVGLVEDADGGRVFINGQLCFAWDAGDAATRRLAAVQLVRIKAAKGYEVAAGFGVDEFTLYRWGQALSEGGPAALVPSRRGPKGPSKLTDALVAEIVERRAAGQGIAEVAAAVGVSARSVSAAAARARAEAGSGAAGSSDDTAAGSTEAAAGSTGEAVSNGSTSEAVSDTDPDIDGAVVDSIEVAAGSTGEAVSDADPEVGAVVVDSADEAAAGSTSEAVSDASPDIDGVMAGSAGADADLDDVDAADAGGVEIGVGAAGLAGDAGAGEALVPVLPGPVDRSLERVAARWGLLPYAPPVFAPAARVPLAGLFLAVPALAATGLLEGARQVYGGVPYGFYGLDAVLCEAVLRALLGEPRAEGATRVNPTDLGRVLGLDRAPEVKTVRRKMGLLAARGKAAELLSVQARRHAAEHQEAMSVLYVDGHVRTYHGTRRIQKTHAPRLRFPAPATVETWIADAHGAPVWVVMAEPGASLASEIRRLLPEIRGIVGDDRRVLVGFDRGGWSPTLFQEMIAAGFDVLTWRKGPTQDVAAELFAEHTHTDEHGVKRTFELADTTVAIPLDEHDPDAGTVTLRQVSKLDPRTGRQVHILTSRTDLTAAQVCFRMGARWREENYFRYGRMHFALDSHDSYAVTDDDPDRSVPNPAKRKAHQAVQAARARLARAETRRDEQLLALRSPTPGVTTVITNQTINQITAPVHAARAELDAAAAAHRATPTRLPLGQVRPGQQVLETETKLLTHAIRMAAFNTQTMLARTITTATGYRKAGNEAHALVRTALAGTGDIRPAPGTLHIRLDPMHTPRATAALAQLCTALNDTAAVFPGTDLEMHYSVKPHR